MSNNKGAKPERRHKPRNLNAVMWAYFSPDGHVQVRTISKTKSISRETIIATGSSESYRDYEASGYVLRRIKIIINVSKTKTT